MTNISRIFLETAPCLINWNSNSPKENFYIEFWNNVATFKALCNKKVGLFYFCLAKCLPQYLHENSAVIQSCPNCISSLPNRIHVTQRIWWLYSKSSKSLFKQHQVTKLSLLQWLATFWYSFQFRNEHSIYVS